MWIHLDASVLDYESHESPGGYPKCAFKRVHLQLMFPQAVKDNMKRCEMILLSWGLNYQISNVTLYIFMQQITKYDSCCPLVGCANILQSKGHDHIKEDTIRGS